MIQFISKTVAAEFLDPRENFSRNKIETEFRLDPLTGESGRLTHKGIITPQKADFSIWESPDYAERCPFCPANIDKATPKFPPELIPQGYIQKGQARVIANLGPYDQYSALTIMGPGHVVPLQEITAAFLKDSFEAALQFLHLVLEKNKELPYSIIAWNYMPPSGGGIVHPHLQVIATDEPGNLYRKTLDSSKRFKEKHGKNYWDELCRVEKERGERFISQTGEGTWLTSFVPLGVLGEILAVFPRIHSIFEITDGVVDELAQGLLRIFKYFDSLGICSFNLSLFPAPRNEGDDYFSLHVHIVPRSFLNLEQKAPDMNALQVVMQEPFAVVRPEEQCKVLKTYF